ncbi:MAG: 50S ribosomal protein L35 [Candidatus Pacebacteria bacterium]|nr:50S ribosomal protein L35 [Candidatus Paceibacterota bacterium]
MKISNRNSFTKRFKVTKNKKLMRRKMAQGHCRFRKSSKQIRGKRGPLSLGSVDAKTFRKYF